MLQVYKVDETISDKDLETLANQVYVRDVPMQDTEFKGLYVAAYRTDIARHHASQGVLKVNKLIMIPESVKQKLEQRYVKTKAPNESSMLGFETRG